jgi:hypothetical protein
MAVSKMLGHARYVTTLTVYADSAEPETPPTSETSSPSSYPTTPAT